MRTTIAFIVAFLVVALVYKTLFSIALVTTLQMGIDLKSTMGANINALNIILSFFIAMFLGVKIFKEIKEKRYVVLKRVAIAYALLAVLLIGSIVVTKVLLQSYENNTTVIKKLEE